MDKLRKYLPPQDIQTVVYHERCADGFGAAFVIAKHRKLVDPNNQIDFIPLSHGTDDQETLEYLLPRITGKNVVFVDICPKESLLVQLVETAPAKCVVLDHHQGQTETFARHPLLTSQHIHFDNTHSGVMLAWEFCFPNQKPPRFLELIEDRDIWSEKYEDTAPFCTIFHKIPYTFEEYERFEDETFLQRAIDEGKTVLKYQRIQIDDIIASAGIVSQPLVIADVKYDVCVMNTNVYFSDIGSILAKQCDFAVMWHYKHYSKELKVSLRSDKHATNMINVATIAKQFGGNGHANAAGFSITLADPIVQVMTPPKPSIFEQAKPFLVAFGLLGIVTAGGIGVGAVVLKK